MKKLISICLLFFSTLIIVSSCKKSSSSDNNVNPGSTLNASSFQISNLQIDDYTPGDGDVSLTYDIKNVTSKDITSYMAIVWSVKTTDNTIYQATTHTPYPLGPGVSHNDDVSIYIPTNKTADISTLTYTLK